MKKIVLLAIISLGILTSCKDKNIEQGENSVLEHHDVPEVTEIDASEEVKILYVASKLDDCVGIAPKKCMMVKEEEDAPWELMYQEIEGFNYEEGYEYKIEVKRVDIPNPPADSPSFRYVLVTEISKEKKA